MPNPVLTTLQCLSAARENPTRQHASGCQTLKRQHVFTLLSAGKHRDAQTDQKTAEPLIRLELKKPSV